jgi:hypothetical protein
MVKCPKCGQMTAQANLYTGQLVCYHRRCGYEEKIVSQPLSADGSVQYQDDGIWYGNRTGGTGTNWGSSGVGR